MRVETMFSWGSLPTPHSANLFIFAIERRKGVRFQVEMW